MADRPIVTALGKPVPADVRVGYLARMAHDSVGAGCPVDAPLADRFLSQATLPGLYRAFFWEVCEQDSVAAEVRALCKTYGELIAKKGR